MFLEKYPLNHYKSLENRSQSQKKKMNLKFKIKIQSYELYVNLII